MDIKGKNVGVWGLGVSGESALEFLRERGALISIIGTEKSTKYELPFILQSSSEVPDFDFVVKSPGIPWDNAFAQNLIKKNIPIISEVELASQFFDGELICVTGTNGKTTTVSLLADALIKNGEEVFLGGNIGIPFCDFFNKKMKASVAVIELSSFQLEAIPTLKPDFAMLLNITPSHGERYKELKDYAKAKMNIINNMTSEDIFSFDEDIEFKSFDSKWSPKCELLPIDLSNSSQMNDELNLEHFSLVGEHNLFNLRFVYEFFKKTSRSLSALQESVNSFSAIEHRIEKIILKNGRLLFNDSKSTNWESTKTALSAMNDKKLILIVGGQLRSDDDYPSEELIGLINSKARKVFTIGESGIELSKLLLNAVYSENLKSASKAIEDDTSEGTILFSPAYPSFDQFKNYVERGLKFKEIFSSSVQ